MYAYIVIDPEIIDNRDIGTPLYRQGAETLFRLITKQNGILAVDNNRNIITNLKKRIPTIPSCKNIAILMEEMLKNNKRMVKITVDNEDNQIAQICEIFREVPCDAIIINDQDKEDYHDEHIDDQPLEYLYTINDDKCRFLKYARRFRDQGVELGYKTWDHQFYSVIGKSTKFTKTISFYDYMIGKIEEGQLNRWTLGIKHIINFWKNHSYYIKDEKLLSDDKIKIELITKIPPPKKNEETMEWDFSNADRQCNNVIRVILEPLKKEFGKYCEFKLIVKNDKYNDFRGRFMKTDQGFLEWRKGFDIFYTNKYGKTSYTRNHVRWSMANDILLIDRMDNYNLQII